MKTSSQNKNSLADLKNGQKAIIVELQGGVITSKKLDAIGLKIGMEIIKSGSMFMKGPITVKIGNLQIALGHSLASKIVVEPRR